MINQRFKILIVLIVISIIGMVTVQVYFFNQIMKSSEVAFSEKVINAIHAAAVNIRKQETNYYHNLVDKLGNTTLQKGNRTKLNLVVSGKDSSGAYINYKQESTVEEINIPLSSIDRYNKDTLSIVNIISGERYSKFEMENPIDTINSFPEYMTQYDLNELKKSDYALKRMATTHGNNTPIHRRVSNFKLREYLKKALQYENLNIYFEFGVFDGDYQTSVVSNGFKNSEEGYITPLFLDNENNPVYELKVEFPGQKEYFVRQNWILIIFNILFTLILLATFVSTILTVYKQKMISEMKTDFINNMTHELKTPLATISVAVDALKNKTIQSSGEKITHYANLIKLENKRLNEQVENVLRISKLEKSQIQLQKETVDVNDLVGEAIDAISLIVEQKNGKIIDNRNQEELYADVDVFHFRNIILNVLENATKYSNANPEITINTLTQSEEVLITVKDNGVGMTKASQKRIFDKFYRVPTGNVHNVKGHGLGLSYVKSIVDLHNGSVSVKSELGKGSEFIIKLPIS